MPAVRVFAPPVDRVGELFAGGGGGGGGGSSHHSHVADRKLQEQEKKKAYAAELQAQMQERQAQRQQERQQRFGGPGVTGAQTSAAAYGAAAGTASADPAPYAAAGSQAFDAPPSPTHAAHLQQQQQPYVGQYQPPDWSNQAGLGSDALLGPGSHASSGSPPPWLQQQQQPGFGLLQPQQPMMQQPGYAGWPTLQQLQQQQQWPGSMGGPPLGCDHPAYTTTAVAPSYHNSMGSSYSPNSISPGRGFQAGANAAAAVAAMQAAAARSGGLGPLAGSWGLSPSAAEAPFAQQQWQQQQQQQQDTFSRGPGGAFGSQPSFNPAGFGAAQPAGPAGSSLGLIGGGCGSGDRDSSTSPLRPRGGVQDKARKDAYRAELEAQIRERSERQAAEKAQRAAEEARKEAEMAAYCPWGRGGAGAPLRDAAGQVVTGLRGAARQQQQQQQQLQQWQQQHDQQQHCAKKQDHASARQHAAWESSHADAVGSLQADPSRSLLASQSFGQQQQHQQQQQQHAGGQGGGSSNGGGGVPGGGGAGPAPVLCFRSDKAFMTTAEIENKQRQQRELQLELDRQVQDKKRQKELKRQQEEEEARQEEARLAAEQARLAAQFQSEQDAERGRRSTKEQEPQQGASTGAGGSRLGGGGELQTSKSEGRRRVSVLMAGDEPTPTRPLQPAGQDLGPGQPSFQQQLHQADQHQQHQQQFYQSQQQPFNMLQQQQQAAAQAGMFDAQQRNQMLYEALQLEGQRPVADHAATHELSRLRHDMESQAASLRSAVESQGREVAALRGIAAAAEAESAAAKAELAQVKRDIKRRSQELPHETLSTMLADYGDGPASALINAAYHPAPVRRIDLELPPSAAALRRSIELQARAEFAGSRGSGGAAGGGQSVGSRREYGVAGGGGGGGGALTASSELLGSSGSAVDLLESLLQQGKAAAGSGRAGRSASGPAGAAGEGVGGAPGWLGSVPLSSAANLRGSMLATESTFIFPAGLQPSAAAAAAAAAAASTAAAAAAAAGGGYELGGGSSAAAWHEPGELGGATSAWDCSWQQQQGQVPPTRHTTSAPGYSSSKAGMPLKPTLSFGRGREGLVTPGGSDLQAVVNRNADKLRVLENMSAGNTGSTEALDQFLSTFVAQSSQPKQPSASGSATPMSRLMTPQVRNRPHRYSNSTGDPLKPTGASAGGGAGVEPLNSFRHLPDIGDTLDLELSKLEVHRAAAMGHDAAAAAAALSVAGRASEGGHGYGASLQAQQRLLLAGTAAGIGAAAAAAAGGSSRGAAAGLDW